MSPLTTLPPSLPPTAERAVGVLDWALEAFGQRVVLASALGPQSLVVLDLLARLGREARVVFLDTDLHFPATYALKRALEARYGLSIESVRPELDLTAQAELHGDRLWERQPDRCCELRKVRPLARVLAGQAAWITGLRRTRGERGNVEVLEWDAQHGLLKINPLAHWTRDEVFEHLDRHDVPRNELLEQGYASVGCWPCTAPASADDERAGRWSGFAKRECGLHRGTLDAELAKGGLR